MLHKCISSSFFLSLYVFTFISFTITIIFSAFCQHEIKYVMMMMMMMMTTMMMMVMMIFIASDETKPALLVHGVVNCRFSLIGLLFAVFI